MSNFDDKTTEKGGVILHGAPMLRPPENEMGVVFLFSIFAQKWGLSIREIRSAFPDCLASEKGKAQPLRIEFEFKSRNFKTHGHDPEECDWVVCWEHNWPDAPENLVIRELRTEFGLGFNVWLMPVNGDEYKDQIWGMNSDDRWSLPPQCHAGDLILFYFTLPDQSISDIFVAENRSKLVQAGWKEGRDHMGAIKRVCALESPIFFEDMKKHKILKTSPFVRVQMRGRQRVTSYWSYLHDLIVERNPDALASLKPYTWQNRL